MQRRLQGWRESAICGMAVGNKCFVLEPFDWGCLRHDTRPDGAWKASRQPGSSLIIDKLNSRVSFGGYHCDVIMQQSAIKLRYAFNHSGFDSVVDTLGECPRDSDSQSYGTHPGARPGAGSEEGQKREGIQSAFVPTRQG